MSLSIDPSEHEATNDLIQDFAVSDQVTVEQVYKVSWNRFNVIEGDHVHIRLFKSLVDDEQAPIDFYRLPLLIHYYMYEGLFTFAGKYRSQQDPGKGRIYYGPQHAQRRRPRFRGDPPERIEQGVADAVEFLNQVDKQGALMAALRFYQKFVNVHPFYDGNGRIGRLIANIYLAEFDLSISWSEFDSKNRFIRKLNHCHNAETDQAFTILHQFVNEHVLHLDELES